MNKLKTLLAITLFLPSASTLFAQSGTIKATVKAVDPVKDTFVIAPENSPSQSMTVKVSPGDAHVDYKGKIVKGTLLDSSNPPYLQKVWPANPQIERKAEEINVVLYDDTMQRRPRYQRKVGESIPPFALYNQNGELTTNEDLKGKLSIMNFIFTRCRNPKMCPASTKRMHELQQQIKDLGLQDKVRFVTVTFDPEYDTPGVLQHYARSYQIDQNNYSFLTGNPDAIENLQKQFGIITQSVDGTINHNMRTLLIDEQGRIAYGQTGPQWSVKAFVNQIKKRFPQEKPSAILR